MSAALREVIASFAVDFDKEGNLAKGDKHVDSFTEKLAEFGKGVIAAFAVEKILEFSKSVVEQADVLAKQSRALGISTADLQGWEHAAQLSGSSAEEFSDAFVKFNKNLAGAAGGTGPAADALLVFGVTAADLKTKLPLELLDQVADGFGAVTDTTKRTAAVMALFGKTGNRLAPLLLEGSKGIAKLRAEVGELGASFDDAFLDNAQEVNDNVDRLKLGMHGLAIQILGPILPGLVRLTTGAISATKGFVALIKQTNIVRGGIGALAVKTIPLLMPLLSSLGAVALEVVAPFLILEDALGFLVGDDSVLGDTLDRLGGAGTGDAVRKWCEEAGTAIKSTFIGALDLLRIAFSDTDEASTQLWEHFELTTRPVESFIDGLVDKVKLLIDAFTSLDTIVQGLADFGDLIASPFQSDGEKTARQQLAKFRGGQLDENFQPIAPSALPDTPANRKRASAYDDIANNAGTYGAPPPRAASKKGRGAIGARVDAVLDRYAPPAPNVPASASLLGGYATAPAAPAAITNNNVQNTVAPVANVNVTVEGGGADVGNRVGKATAKAVTDINTRVIKAALVPTPG
jgi:hypothetical protein